MKRLRLFLAALAIVCSFLPAVPALAATDVFQGACSGTGSSNSAACQAKGDDPLTGPNGIITRATRLVGYITGVAAIIIMIVGGFMYVTSDGDSSKISNAKNTVIYAFVGLIIVIAAQAIIVFILSRI